MKTEDLIKELVVIGMDMRNRGSTTDEILAIFRTKGAGKGVSIGAIMKVLNLDAGEAKVLVHYSKAWTDVKDRDEKFHRQLEKVLQAFDGKHVDDAPTLRELLSEEENKD